MKIKSYLRNKWQSLTPRGKKISVIIILFSIAFALAFGMYFSTRGGKPRNMARGGEVKKREITLDTHLLDMSAYQKSQEKLTIYEEEVKKLKSEFAQFKQAGQVPPGQIPPGQPCPAPGHPAAGPVKPGVPVPTMLTAALQDANAPKAASAPAVPKDLISRALKKNADQKGAGIPIPMPDPDPRPGMGRTAAGSASEASPDLLGSIETVSGKSGVPGKDSAEKKSLKQTVFLPPSFMAATMLSGLDAPTAESGKGNPVPVLLRVKDLAFLPNQVRANLKGCFVICDGNGSLADERAHLRIKSISCLSKKGTSVIDQDLKGFVVDTDGKIGLRGTVVSKMGAVVARSLLAGLFGGLGDAIRAQTQTVAVSPLGTTQTINTNQIAQAGVGEGIATASKELQKFYLDLAKQTMPVVEVGAVRDVTLVVSEGADLVIKDVNRVKKY